MKRLLIPFVLASSLFAAGALIPPPSVSPVLQPPPPLVSSLDSMSLGDFVRYASKALNKNILVSGTLSGSIDFVSNKYISNPQILSLLRSALELNKYALVDKGAYYMVIPSADLPKYPTAIGSGYYRTKVYKISYSKSLSILESVKSLLSASGSAFSVSDSNALVVSDLPENLNKISRLVSDLDIKSTPKNIGFKSFRLVNASSASVAQTLRGIFATDDNQSTIEISDNNETNTLFIQGDEIALDKMPSLIAELDREQYQVYIQIRIIELNNDLSSQIGIKYGLSGGIVSASDFFTFSANVGGSSIAPIDTLLKNKLIGSLGNVNQLLSIGAALDLLKAEGVSKTISEPSLLCLNNKESKVTVGKSLSFLKGTTTGAAGTSNSLDRSDIGLNLTVKPLVASKDKLTLSIDAILGNVLPALDSNNQPITTKQEIKTDSILHHGETIVLGGFVKSYETQNNNSIPFLSDLPLIGGMFNDKAKQKTTDNLLLVITPYIVDDSKTLSSLQADLGLFGQLQKQVNKGIK